MCITACRVCRHALRLLGTAACRKDRCTKISNAIICAIACSHSTAACGRCLHAWAACVTLVLFVSSLKFDSSLSLEEFSLHKWLELCCKSCKTCSCPVCAHTQSYHTTRTHTIDPDCVVWLPTSKQSLLAISVTKLMQMRHTKSGFAACGFEKGLVARG